MRVLLVGCGDVGLRLARALPTGVRLLALSSSEKNRPTLRAQGMTVLMGDLDNASSLRRLSGLAQRVVHLAPPPTQGWHDPRTLALVQALRLRSLPEVLIYGSTSGVYGDCQGERVRETRAVAPGTPRARRRADAEDRLRFLGRAGSVRTSIMRIPGIYAADREGGTPRERLLKRTPVLQASDDVYTNHIHADDLARACIAALWHGKAQRVYNVNDDSELKMGDYFDLAADVYGLARPPRLARGMAHDQLPLLLLSFMGESRRMDNTRLKRELRFKLRYAHVQAGLTADAGSASSRPSSAWVPNFLRESS